MAGLVVYSLAALRTRGCCVLEELVLRRTVLVVAVRVEGRAAEGRVEGRVVV